MVSKYSKAVRITVSLAALLCLSALLVYVAIYNTHHSGMPAVKDGVLDLTGWDMEKDGPVALDGEWEFYWQEFLQEKDLGRPEIQAEKLLVNVPGTWDKYQNGAESFPGFGYATYRIKVIPGDNRLDGLKIMPALTASSLIVNGKEYALSGTPGTDAMTSIPARAPALVRIDDNGGVLDIIIHVSNFTEAHGGLYEGIKIGSYGQLQSEDRLSFARDAFILGCLFVIAIYFFCIFLMRRNSKESLYFSIGCVTIALKLLFSENYFMLRLFPDFPYTLAVFLFFISLYWGVFMFSVFINSFYPEEGSKKLVRVHFILAAAFTVFSLVTPFRVFTAITPAYDWINLSVLAYIVFVISKAAYKGLFGARTIVIGVLFMALAVAHDILKGSNIINSPFEALTSIGSVVLIILLAVVQAARLANDHRQLQIALDKVLSSETAFLQAQIKPHFLYNTINAIIASCHTDAAKAADMLLDLSDYLRYMFDFDSEEKLVPLEREIEAVNAYLSLEKARFAGSLEYSIEMEDDENILIPPMLIQPLVENAVRHGLRKVEREGRLTIKGEKTEGFYTITVEDNGAGIAEDDLEKILRGEKKEGTGTGLKNVRKRLGHFYGTDVEITSIPGTETKISVKVKTG
ncbi:MAG: sensor histidine kinase [Firmicutes bacterium]|nr:sensor histidine kinase [Bacillota bacterium]